MSATELWPYLALILVGGLSLIIGSYFSFVARRIEDRPEDNPDAETSDGAGELGFFSPGSYWPVGIAAAATLGGLGLAFSEWWLLVVGLVGVLFTAGGLLFEYYTRGHTTPTIMLNHLCRVLAGRHRPDADARGLRARLYRCCTCGGRVRRSRWSEWCASGS